MTDPASGLRSLLTDAVPPPPDLLEIAHRAEHTARARRTRRRTTVGALAAAAAVLAAVAVPSLLPDPSAPQSAAPDLGATCVPTLSLDHPDLASGRAVWARFCAPPVLQDELERGGAVVPFTTLRTGVSDLVRGWSQPADCPSVFGARTFSIQVGYADGSVALLSGDTACASAPYQGLMAALAGNIDPSAERASLECPPSLPAGEDLGRRDVLDGLAETAVRGGLLCRYRDDMALAGSPVALSAAEAERVRSTALGGFQRIRQLRCRVDAPRDYAVLLAGADGQVWSVSVFSDRPCNPTVSFTVADQLSYAGEAGQPLVDLLDSLSTTG